MSTTILDPTAHRQQLTVHALALDQRAGVIADFPHLLHRIVGAAEGRHQRMILRPIQGRQREDLVAGQRTRPRCRRRGSATRVCRCNHGV